MYEERSTQPLHAKVDAVRTYIDSHTCPTVDPKRIDSAEQVRVDAVRTYVHQLAHLHVVGALHQRDHERQIYIYIYIYIYMYVFFSLYI
jgi:hypothetical protein